MIKDYNRLFHQIDGAEAQEEIEGAFGESFAEQDPTLLSLVEQAQISSMSGPDLEPRRDICSGDAFLSSMRLDQIITSCIFAMVQYVPKFFERLQWIVCMRCLLTNLCCIFALQESVWRQGRRRPGLCVRAGHLQVQNSNSEVRL